MPPANVHASSYCPVNRKAKPSLGSHRDTVFTRLKTTEVRNLVEDAELSPCHLPTEMSGLRAASQAGPGWGGAECPGPSQGSALGEQTSVGLSAQDKSPIVPSLSPDPEPPS